MSSREAPAAFTMDKKELIGKKPVKVVLVPPEFRRRTYPAERDGLVNDVKVRTGCDLVVHWDNGRICQFDLYGSAINVTDATGILHQWISAARQKSKDSSSWAKLTAFNADKWYYDRVEEMEQDRKEVFLGPIPQSLENGDPLYSITVEWPEDLQSLPVTPRDAFGNKLESLNELRMRDEVFITLLPFKDGVWTVEISGYTARNIESARAHYVTMIEKVRIEEYGLKDPVVIILDDEEGMYVKFEAAKSWWPASVNTMVPRLVASSLMFEAGCFRQRPLQPKNLSVIQQAVYKSLEAVRLRKGSFDFVVRLGCLGLRPDKMAHGEIGKSVTKDAFQAALKSNTAQMTKKWAFDTELGSEILRRFMTANELLEPTTSAANYSSPPANIGQTRPVYRGTWVFSDPNQPLAPAGPPVRHSGRPAPLQHKPATPAPSAPSSLWVVQVDFTHDEDAVPEMISQQFYKLEPNMSTPKDHMDIHLLELGVSRSWKFALESMIKVPKRLTPPILTNFAGSVKMRPKHDSSSLGSFAQWDQAPTALRHLRSGRLDEIYSFGLKNTCYKVELTAMWSPGQGKPVWGLGVRHSEWATHLGGLESLPAGGKAKWGHTTSTFLPDDGLSYAGHEDEVDMMGGLSFDSNAEVPYRNGICILTKCLMGLSEIVVSASAPMKDQF